ncbi:hypothetical protein [Ktedonobacter racemifer]|uniref:Uncharacterized protein n=1 Tax=Ktedonobacter racemifer DSM 44963 TaxID=485913 RepID=D6TC64_KTERA|nr:hypothetical protein [Ktedonobacter racemifer]EFH88100.1 hypothetical protein Krac_9491 [Ktedonobacter racemifer DSM 44963]
MQNDPNSNRSWEGTLALVMALPMFVLACIGFSISLLWPLSHSWWQADRGASLLLLLSYIAFAIHTITTHRPVRLLMLRYALRTAFLIGLLIGAALLWPGLSQNWRGLGIMLMVLVPIYVPMNPGYIFADFPWNFLIVLLTVLCIFLYGNLGYQLMRRTGRIVYSLEGAFFAGIFVPLSLAFLIGLVRDLPWVLQTTQFPLYERLEYYYLYLLNSFFSVYSQIILALLAGWVGALVGRMRSHVDCQRLSKSHRTDH